MAPRFQDPNMKRNKNNERRGPTRSGVGVGQGGASFAGCQAAHSRWLCAGAGGRS
jgi:hypothetical protein